MSEPQLERSVLEAKEREELFAIANALGTGPTSRARKSDLVNQILQATGVEVADAPKEVPERPRRTRAKKAVAPDPESVVAAPTQSTLPLTASGSSTDEAASAADTAAPAPSRARTSIVRAGTPRASGLSRSAPAEPSVTADDRSDSAGGGGQDEAGDGPSAGGDASGLPPRAGQGDDDGRAVARSTGAVGAGSTRTGSGAGGPVRGSGAPGAGAPVRGSVGSPRTGPAGTGEPPSSGLAVARGSIGARPPSGQGPTGPAGRVGPGGSPVARSVSPGRPAGRSDANSRDGGSPSGPAEPGPSSLSGHDGAQSSGGLRRPMAPPAGGRDGAPLRNGRESPTGRDQNVDGRTGPRTDPANGGQRNAQDTGNDQGGDANGSGPGGHLEADTGNRRSRRRRGRDRGERVERELTGQAPEQAFSGDPMPVSGYLDLREEGYGFLRSNGYLSGPDDIYVSISQARRFALRRGDHIEGGARPAGGNEKYPALLRVEKVSGLEPEEARDRPRFEALTPLFPDSKLKLEIPGDPANLTARIVDLVSPIGKGQRGMIVSPPKAGKTTILKQIAHSIEANNPEVHLMVLLVDERPEEVTDMRRSVHGEVIASTFDRPAEEHIQLAELAIERAKRMVELGRDVVIVLDGITRLARAYNLSQPPSGRVMSGGIDTGALYPPKKFFGAARNIEEGGSLTILATALVETGSRMDEVIFEEFKGTGNMELRLDRRMAERRVYPAIDVNGSSTRHEELLLDRAQLQQVWKLRRVLNALSADGSPGAGLELLIDRLKSTRSNDEFLAELAKNPAPGV